MLAQNLASSSSLFSNSSYKFSITGFISGLKFSFSRRLLSLFFSMEILIISWMVNLLDNVLAFSLKQDWVYFQHLLFAGFLEKEANPL